MYPESRISFGGGSFSDMLRAALTPPTLPALQASLSAEQLAAAIRESAKNGVDLTSAQTALNDARRQTEATKPLRDAAAEARRQGVKARRFVLAYRYNSSADTTIGITEGILEKDDTVDITPTWTTPIPIDGKHGNLDALKAKMERSNLAYYIDFLD